MTANTTIDFLPFPSKCILEATTYCNLKCGICNHTLYPPIEENMSLSVFNKLNSIFIKSDSVTFCGTGEFFLHPNYAEMIKCVKFNDNYLSIISNGTLLDDKTCFDVVKSAVDSLTISIDGASSATYNYIRKGSDFHTVINNIQNLVNIRKSFNKLNPNITISITVTRLNISELPDLIRLAHELKVDGVEAHGLIEYVAIKDEKLKSTNKGREYLEQAEYLARKLKIKFNIHQNLVETLMYRNNNKSHLNLLKHSSSGIRRKMCQFPWDSVQINFNGDVNPCCLPSRILGNIDKDDFTTIWNNPKYNEFRRKLRSEHPFDECLKCEAMPWSDPICHKLDMEKASRGQLGEGWYDLETSPKGFSYRWMGRKAFFYISNKGNQDLYIELFTIKEFISSLLPLNIFINGSVVKSIIITDHKLQKVKIDKRSIPAGLLEIGLKTGSTFLLSDVSSKSIEPKHVSIAVCSAIVS